MTRVNVYFSFDIGQVIKTNGVKWIVAERRLIETAIRQEVSYYVENAEDRDEGYWVNEEEIEEVTK